MKNNPILLVEDNPHEEALTIRALKRGGIVNEIVVARDGAEALERLFPHISGTPRVDKGFALILLDLKIPKLDGLEVLARIRAEPSLAPVPVVILTSSSQEADLVEGYKLGANSYIRKPVDFDRFSEAVRQLGLYWLVLNETPAPPAAAAGYEATG